MKQRFRLRRRQDFERVMGTQRVYAGRAIVAFVRPNQEGRWRVGVTASRGLRTAVRRNRVRRRLREAARAGLLAGKPPAEGTAYDVVLIGRPAALGVPFTALEEETARLRRRLARA
ncbi:MAG TPA: ribonuclease P protein component [Streptosporangiaceae bacterium]